MIPGHTQMERALASAAEQPLAILHADREHFASKGECGVAAVLAFLAEHLFEGEVTAQVAAAAADSSVRSISRRLRAYNGQSLYEYMSALRFETATNWLRADHQIEVDEVAERVGLSGWRLRRLCREWLGQPPTSCRLPPPPFDPKTPATWQRVARGDLTPAEQQELAAYVRATWPAAYEAACAAPAPANHPAPSPILPTDPPQPTIDRSKPVRVVDREALVRSFGAHQLWPLLSGLSYGAQREIVALCPCQSTAIFDLLRQKSREQGRRDPQRGIELAELALLSLDVSASAFGERIHELRALGWAWLGNAQRLALDYPGAEEAFKKAFAELAHVKGGESSVVAADVYALKGSLRIFQRRFEEALELLHHSVGIFERSRYRRRQTEELISRAAAASYAGWSETAISDLTVALGIAKELKAEDLAVMVTISLGATLVNSGEFERGAAVVAAVDRSSCQLLNPLFFYHLECVEAVAEHGLGKHASAEKKYPTARAGFEALGQPFYTALVDLHLAILYAQTSRPADVVRSSSAALRFFEALTLGRETMLSLRLLKDGLRRQAVTETMLRDLRSTLQADPLIELSKAAGPEPKSPRLKVIDGHPPPAISKSGKP